jgi:peptide-methionine (R)-S-oxide reductase
MARHVEKTDAEWREQLTPEQYDVCRQQATEAPFSGKYDACKDDGVYVCVCCGQELFDAEYKFDSGSGWPSFTRPVEDGNVDTEADQSRGMVRTEVKCSACDAHLGHVFPDAPLDTGDRYCINSASIDLKARK